NEPMIDVVKTRNDNNMVNRINGYPSYRNFDRKIHIDCAYNLQFSCMIGFEHVNTNFFPILSINVMSKKFYNSIMKEKVEYNGRNVLGTFMNAPIFVGNFSIVTDFTVVENMDAYRDEGMREVIVGEPFCKASYVEARRFDGMITIFNGNDSINYQMVRSHPRFKYLTDKRCNKIPPLLKIPQNHGCAGDIVDFRTWLDHGFVGYPFDYRVTLGFGSIAGGIDHVNPVIRLPLEHGISRELFQRGLIICIGIIGHAKDIYSGTMVGVDINTLTMEQYLALSRENEAPSMVKPEIEGNVNFEIKSQFMREFREDTFSGNKNEDAHDHVDRVFNIVSLFNIPRVSQDAVLLCVFPFTHSGSAKRWVDRLTPGAVNTWDLLKKAFIQRYCPPSKTAKRLEDIYNFKQESDESLYQAWERYNDLLYKCPTHDINSH
ncbi:homeodomain-like protein, partial [Tanacetum coccineum]